MSQFDRLRDKFPKDSEQISAMERSALKAEILLSLKGHEGMRMLETDLADKVVIINRRLLSDEKMTEHERDLLLKERQCWLWFIEIFPNAEKTLDRINHLINEKL